MIADLLRCPVDPKRQTPLIVEDQGLSCRCCQVIFLVVDGLPVLVPSEAKLPLGISSLDELPCRRMNYKDGRLDYRQTIPGTND